MILGEFRIDNKVTIVTGASRGIGQAMAVALAEAGADVVVVGHKTPSDDTVDRIVRIGRRCIPITPDLANLDNIEKILEKVYPEIWPN